MNEALRDRVSNVENTFHIIRGRRPARADGAGSGPSGMMPRRPEAAGAEEG